MIFRVSFRSLLELISCFVHFCSLWFFLLNFWHFYTLSSCRKYLFVLFLNDYSLKLVAVRRRSKSSRIVWLFRNIVVYLRLSKQWKQGKWNSENMLQKLCSFHRSLFTCVWYISYSRLLWWRAPVIYNCEPDRYALGKSLFQSDKPLFESFLPAACLSFSTQFLSFCYFFFSLSFSFGLCTVVCFVAPTSVVLLRDGEPDGTCKTIAPSSTL